MPDFASSIYYEALSASELSKALAPPISANSRKKYKINTRSYFAQTSSRVQLVVGRDGI